MKKILLTLLLCIGTASAFAAASFQELQQEVMRSLASINNGNIAKIERGCAAGKVMDCSVLGFFYGEEGDDTKAESYLKKACRLDGVGCAFLGIFKADAEEDVNAALPYLKKGCDANSAPTCLFLGTLYTREMYPQEIPQEAGGFRPDNKLAGRYLQKACRLDGDACIAVGMLEAKKQADYAAAVPYIKKRCNAGGVQACTMLGGMYAQGEGVAQDDKLAVQYLQKACRLGGKEACAALQ